MPRDNDKNNDSRGRRDRLGKGRSGAARGPEKKFAKRGFAGKSDGDKRPYAGKPDGAKSYGKKPYAGSGKPYAGKREGPPPRRDGDAPRRDYGDARDRRASTGRTVHAAIGLFPIVRRAAATAKSARTPRAAT